MYILQFYLCFYAVLHMQFVIEDAWPMLFIGILHNMCFLLVSCVCMMKQFLDI